MGNAWGGSVPDFEPAFEARVGTMYQFAHNVGSRGDKKVEIAQKQMDDFADLLARRGITVSRPEKLENKPTMTPHWIRKTMQGWMCPRDVLLAIGNEIIETPMNFRSRVFEHQAYRSILADYFKRDPN